MLESLDAAVVRRWSAAGLAALRDHQREINELNVFPVPDADTGTNLVLTVTAADGALAADPALDGLGAALRCLARGAVLGARGNSGAIIAQL
ncbi:DAK2 domain-containing protein, partial [Luedemannella flava]|uniref:DAK2 domain-containing protein n=1 Tax=Luedemannella flava TaxID=349316 RepID=UPI0031CE006E